MSEPLPVVATAREIYAILGREWRRIVAFAWPVALLCVLASILEVKLLDGTMQFGQSPHVDAGRSLEIDGLSLLVMVFFLPLATSVHRLVLQGDRARIGVSFQREELRYFQKVVLLGLLIIPMIALPVALFLALVSSATGRPPTNPVLDAAAVLIAIALLGYMIRFYMVLPAAAIGKRLSLRQSADLLRGNAIRLFLVFVVAFLPIIFFQMFVGVATLISIGWDVKDGMPSDGMTIGVGIASGLLKAVTTVLCALALSVAFKHVGGPNFQPTVEPTPEPVSES